MLSHKNTENETFIFLLSEKVSSFWEEVQGQARTTVISAPPGNDKNQRSILECNSSRAPYCPVEEAQGQFCAHAETATLNAG